MKVWGAELHAAVEKWSYASQSHQTESRKPRVEAPYTIILKTSNASEGWQNWPLPHPREYQWECVIQDFCGMRLMFKKHGGEFCTKRLKSSQKKKELMNGWVLARIREGKCGTWLNRMQELSNHQMHLRCSRRRQWDYLTVWGRSSVFEPVFLTSKESMFPALVRTYNQIK